MPLVSYQHGTVFSKKDVPSYPENSFETRLILAQFAGFGTIVIAPDYYGRGDSNEKDSYLVLDSQQTSCLYMYYASLELLEKEGYTIINFYLTGWSQGGMISMAFLQLLETLKIRVKAVGTAACQNDSFSLLNQIAYFNRKEQASWVFISAILVVFAYEEYYNQPGLAQGFINPYYYDNCYRLYNGLSFQWDQIPINRTQLMRPEYLKPEFLRESQFGKLLLNANVYRFLINTPVHMHYGHIDESANVELLKLAELYQRSMGNSSVESISEGLDATHRITFARSIPKWRYLFNDSTKV